MPKTSTKKRDPAVVASHVYNKIFENSAVRVFDIRFKPGAKADMHWHPNHFAYIFEDGELDVMPPGEKTMKLSAKAGDTAWMDTGHHEAINRGSRDFHALVVELKGSTKKLKK
jgi:quercetin dioxygenase-like cupin family protein